MEKFRKILSITTNIVIIIAAAWIISYAFFYQVKMPGGSMQPSIMNNENLMVNRLTYKIAGIQRFDCILFLDYNGKQSIKRVIGLPSETVSIRDGFVYVDKKVIEHKSVEKLYIRQRDLGPIVLTDDEYFVLGDNTEHSEDSRFVNFGNVQANEIKGKIIYRILPKEKSGKIK